MTKFTKLTILLLIFLLIALTGCKSIKLDSAYTSNPININGDYSDWRQIPALYFEDQEVLLALSNDTDNIYLAFRFRDPKWLVAVRKTGLTIWLDNEAKKKEQFGIRYSGGPNPQDNIGFEQFRKNMPVGQNPIGNRYVDTTKLFAVLNSEWWYKEQNIPTDGTFGPMVKYGFENDMYTYEFAIPLDTIGENFYGINAEPGKTISIGLEFGDMGMTRSGSMGRGGKSGGATGMPGIDVIGPSGGKGGGGGGKGGGGRGGGMGGGDRAAMMNNMPDKQKIWIKTKLAVTE